MDRAVAIQYIPDLPAPFVVAKGKNHLAEKIVRYARENGIAIVPAASAEPLFDLDVGDLIPEEYFTLVAEILAFIYTIREETADAV